MKLRDEFSEWLADCLQLYICAAVNITADLVTSIIADVQGERIGSCDEYFCS